MNERMTVIGVAQDVKHSGLNQPVDPAFTLRFHNPTRPGDDG